MKIYIGNIFRPPSEANSIILQVTVGCSHNKCTFCGMYKDKVFQIRPLKEVKEIINFFKLNYPFAEKVFLADGDALSAPTEYLIEVIKMLKNSFPRLKKISSYAGPKSLLIKNAEELRALREHGISLLYLGLESGSDTVLKKVQKGFTAEEIIHACQKAKEANFELSLTVISGLGGKELWQEHALSSAEVVSKISPHFLATLTLMLVPGTKLFKEAEENRFQLLSSQEILQELKLFLQNLNLSNTVFRSNHASNYLPLKGILNQDRAKLIKIIDEALEEKGIWPLRPEYLRRL
ncbi:radical SAM protein [Carboxydothermus islandicus]|uniref:Radical SAM protein n=1 Tax=Carboxydothermus islandicus TaxID=661089 RepID=A0A1L8D3V1_9THEO|nr:radical SAM protein [Carboxydothermus islandicus]GAV25839.1 radical SAM protein [Carboxydothermus islandicus]